MIQRLLFVFLVAGLLMSTVAHSGFQVSGTQLLDANGQQFVMRGVNHPHAWYRQNKHAIADIAKAGANTVRIVLSNGTQWNKIPANEVSELIGLCKNNQLICMFEVHDTTGYGEKAEATTIAQAASYWVEIASALKTPACGWMATKTP